MEKHGEGFASRERRLRVAWALAAWFAACVLTGSQLGIKGAEPAPEVSKWVEAVIRNQRTTGLRARAKLSIEPRQGAERSVQVLIKERRDGAVHETLVVSLWPREEKGRAWMLRRTAIGDIEGFRFTPPEEVTPISAANLDERLFDSDLGVDDFAESFWEWTDVKAIGEEKIGSTVCRVVEFRTVLAGVRHPRVRAWLPKEKPVPLRVEKYDVQDVLSKRMSAGRVVHREDGGWSVAEWTVETVPAGSRTRVSGSRSDRDLVIPPEEFTVEGIRKLIQP